ncbi:hypothetical protein Clacol_004819 [Clathrus columnatus]|uniref:Uncharacterized protein n=1 Tax=Clathrus columnatus TaxID=1419009 RepID=A0AAV5A7J7_9AGAM|nr:hypothetical protein Clacol_004819 [Clathrus columnatus]
MASSLPVIHSVVNLLKSILDLIEKAVEAKALLLSTSEHCEKLLSVLERIPAIFIVLPAVQEQLSNVERCLREMERNLAFVITAGTVSQWISLLSTTKKIEMWEGKLRRSFEVLDLTFNVQIAATAVETRNLQREVHNLLRELAMEQKITQAAVKNARYLK